MTPVLWLLACHQVAGNKKTPQVFHYDFIAIFSQKNPLPGDVGYDLTKSPRNSFFIERFISLPWTLIGVGFFWYLLHRITWKATPSRSSV